MTRHQSKSRACQKIVLIVLVSILNAFVVPTGFGGAPNRPRDSAPHEPTTNAFDSQSDFIRLIPMTTNDVVYSASTGKLYASVPSSVGSGGNSIKTIDPTTGLVTSSVVIGSEPNKLALSDDGHSLYAS